MAKKKNTQTATPPKSNKKAQVADPPKSKKKKAQEVDPRRFWVGVFAGLAVMLIINGLVVATINTLISLFSTVLGGFVAGWIVAGGKLHDYGLAGLYAGILNAVVVAVLILIFGLIPSPEDLGVLALLGSTLLIVIAFFPLWGLLGYFGGFVAGKLKGH